MFTCSRRLVQRSETDLLLDANAGDVPLIIIGNTLSPLPVFSRIANSTFRAHSGYVIMAAFAGGALYRRRRADVRRLHDSWE